jgi:hypothetical protein
MTDVIGLPSDELTCTAARLVDAKLKVRRSPSLSWRTIVHPLSAVCLLQAALSLSLVWSNTAFTDEAEFLWGGRLEISHWLHGTPLPSVLGNNFFGSPIIYPPVGALANAVGGLAAARILSLIFMVGATVLLYLVVSRIFGPVPALFASALWAVSEPVLRIGAFATYDAMSILFTALATWFIVQAAYRRRRGEYVAAAAAALALANATAYSGAAFDPVVIMFAFLVWVPAIGARQARFCTAWLCGVYAILFTLVMTVSHSWIGLLAVNGIVSHNVTISSILGSAWAYSESWIVLSAVGVVAGIAIERRSRRILLVVLGCAGLIIPAVQIIDRTSVSIDQHLPYGIWFSVIAAGYGCSVALHSLPTSRWWAVVLCCFLALAYPAVNNWEAAWNKQLSWSNTSSFIVAFKPIIAQERGLIDASNENYVAMYYTVQGIDWTRWNRSEQPQAELPLDPSWLAPNSWTAYYSRLLRKVDYGAIALFYTTTIHGLPSELLVPSHDDIAREKLLELVASNTGSAHTPMRGLAALTVALEADPQYRLVAVGPCDTNTIQGIYAIWRKKTAV